MSDDTVKYDEHTRSLTFDSKGRSKVKTVLYLNQVCGASESRSGSHTIVVMSSGVSYEIPLPLKQFMLFKSKSEQWV